MAVPNFETTIGLEVHVELKTNSKAMSPSPVQYGAEPNANTNVIDWGYPGVLPQANKGALEYGMMAALALNADVTRDLHWDRKNYFYPDNPKAYQITQQQEPIGRNGWLEIEFEGEKKRVGITELHVEEDAGKNTHGTDGYSYVDLNRQGTPLIEIVGAPDISSPDEAYAYLEALRQAIQFTGISDVKMQEGSMRVDANISIRPVGSKEYGTKVELKNLNSFNYVRKALAFEEERHAKIYMAGGTIKQQTRRFDEATGETVLMREKETADDYRYFPEPDLTPVHITDEWVEEVRAKLPESATERKARYVDELGLEVYDSEVLTQTLAMANFFDATVAEGADPKRSANYLMGDVNAFLNEKQVDLEETALTPAHLAGMIKLIDDGTISTKMAKKVFVAITQGEDPVEYVEANGLKQLSDPAILTPIIDGILDDNEQSIIDFHNGKDRAVGFLVGKIMKETKGNANPNVVNELLMVGLNARKPQ
ncbi:Asp-tRNA(Asn)/Glu-tRNA(Gln) amidotransferase subunit GatB [Weissella confusa]|uniref:Asp-tRNA(Asn)/Glu-tRNA(Gln) amidotransferase subunit GatB n=1 Tax=Weissella confusa TaxID=1583 RepID=UPI0018F1E34F|nr:Asp-tRNA(Asn)/Glu-tRNA(Gln) amidotransferase subunit GatB [Weissella confusa]MBJ7617283.1 Asp-tRNA(Asn)/Glu-tRNA(Gln) amidotransferase subunit GatB [Weissella confusa]MBJ7623707.1 Asp-tRNA(Asn)/Glu-tRNA(Gln) amidotransferase subunit GatB [Weissella confusa]MBJ7648849.1 Asp-tRNA(Asn)/Glu-tRNA(Gln) amidotransferase subunit GatB [Weissella confusa]MBJ7650672.1 Asp-tRNA(Asn)/Glu-tRNA(Gln) amidotransferase subunit GatB [Weissella confusa]MBJ7656677.1 Asp-tRNA(Asn)/Glu-tRNA(Gln) amidotransferase 